MRTFGVILIVSVLLAAAAAVCSARGRPLVRFDDAEDELTQAQRELEELESRIRRREIPPIEFELGKAVLRRQSKRTLEMVADLMFRHPRLKLWVLGHTCDLGDERYNRWLSQKRAEAVKDYLVEMGVMGEAVRAKGFGESRPLVPNDSAENREKNRRVEFRLINRKWGTVF
ncbi:MAG: OmpA family protein [Elusimicrobiota bacterium]